MAQIFPRWTNDLPLYAAIGGALVAVLLVGGVWYYFSPEYTDVGYQPAQPVDYSHKLHAGEMQIDCRYCHASDEKSAVANVPPTQTCMNCHLLVARQVESLAPLRDSAKNRMPMRCGTRRRARSNVSAVSCSLTTARWTNRTLGRSTW